MKKIYEGKAKIVYEGETSDTVIMEFKNSLTAFDGIKKAEIEGKGELNWKISSILMNYIKKIGIPTHFINKLENNRHLCQKVEIIPIEVVCRNKTAGSFCKRYGVEEGNVFSEPIIEYFYKKDELHDPVFSNEVILAMKIVNKNELEVLRYYGLIINHYLKELFKIVDLELIDFKLEFGKNRLGKIVLADEITPDTMRLWRKDVKELSEKILDKDRFRRDLGPVNYGYDQVLKKLEAIDFDKIDIPNPKVFVQVNIELKKAIADPAGEATQLALKRQGFNYKTVRIGKIVLLETEQYVQPTEIENIISKLLINPLIENYSIKYEF